MSQTTLNQFKREEGSVVTITGGVHFVKELYSRAGSDKVYANFGSGFIRLGPPGFTSKKGTTYENLESDSQTLKLGVGTVKEPIWVQE